MQTPVPNTDFCLVRIGGKLMCVPHNTVITSLQNLLLQNSQAKTATLYGLKSAQIQTLFDSFYTSTLQHFPPQMQIYFGYRFLALHSPEEKRIGILTLSKNIPAFNSAHLADFERIFDNDINDWMICDALANKVVTQLLRSHDDVAARVFTWKDSGKIWRMRACCVIYVNFANTEEEKCFSISSTCVKSSERFVQLGVGCLLREMSLNSTEAVVKFIYENYRYFTREGLRYSIDKLDIATRKMILGIGKGRNSGNGMKTPDQASSPKLEEKKEKSEKEKVDKGDDKKTKKEKKEKTEKTTSALYERQKDQFTMPLESNGMYAGQIQTMPMQSVNIQNMQGMQQQNINQQIQQVDDQLKTQILQMDYLPGVQNEVYQVVLPNGQISYVQHPRMVMPANYQQYYELQGFTQDGYSQNQ
ncbi:hypothetical protein EIN_163910 [Entamoeba invadens IP1]|uniref:Uncharacterized protein n=1 Tax=Entamoeba invadens IP1 TaxID=370355 RepID=A0A0A1U7J4_ENTIV|nr:hypothetical protein EIN_163910 [Entamoeba invadens IP1]ELP89021.1 hypothetical protein EIN_163910 [Entamoeba invadens IP1]|eukprot:XP_004255792.1 hypothetical protein EIN_163910 [Entamoeba invadens IP1]